VSLFSSPPPDPPDPEGEPAPRTRPPFSAARAVGAPPAARDAPAPLRVSQLAARINEALRAGLPAQVRVIGEISGFRDRTHWYFSLKDDAALLSCVMFASAIRRAGFTPEDGTEVVAAGRVEHFPKWGKTQLYVETLEPVGAGALELRYRKLVEEIRARGWFDEDRKKPLPRFPRRIAVVTAATGAALQDVLDTLRRRAPFIDVLTADVRVQGDRAAPDIARALARLGKRRDVDLIILTRGGGSIEDLWAFNEPVVAEAIVRCPIPLIAAIGHETDTTIAELVADLRAATPTQAAVRAAPDADALLEQLDRAEGRLAAGLHRSLDRLTSDLRAAEGRLLAIKRARLHRASDQLHRLAARLARRHPSAVYAARRTTLDDLESRLVRTVRRSILAKDPLPLRRRLSAAAAGRVRDQRARLADLERLLATTSPLAALRRGYSITMTESGRVLRSAEGVRAGDPLITRLADGTIRSTATGGRRRPRPRTEGDAPTLFDPADD